MHIHTLRIERLHTHGDMPGLIYRHRALATSPHEIRVWAGKIITMNGAEEMHGDNHDVFILDIETLVWRREGA